MAFENEVQDFTAQGTDLPESKLSTGFLPGEKPPANWFNSLFFRLSQGVKELQIKAIEKEYVDEQIEVINKNIIETKENISNVEEEVNKVKEDVDKIQADIEAKTSSVTFDATISASGWSSSAPFYVDVTVTGILSTDKPHITPTYTGTLSTDQERQEAWNKIDRIVANADSIRVYAFEEVPTVAIPVQIQVVR